MTGRYCWVLGAFGGRVSGGWAARGAAGIEIKNLPSFACGADIGVRGECVASWPGLGLVYSLATAPWQGCPATDRAWDRGPVPCRGGVPILFPGFCPRVCFFFFPFYFHSCCPSLAGLPFDLACASCFTVSFCAPGVSEKGRPWRVVFMVVGFFFVRFFLKLVTINFLVSLIASSPTRTIFPSDHQDQLVPPCRGPCRAQDVRRCLVVGG